MNWQDRIIPLLPHVAKPVQYVGRELNAVHKAWEDGVVKVGLCFPDAYEVGMSHLGLHLLYSILNAYPHIVAERFYAPLADMEMLMRARRIPLFSLESHRSAAEFDILGFTLQYELSYSNILNMLSLADIPLKAEDRTEEAPLIIAGGPCSYNPEPLADFVDLFVIGDGEEIVPRLVNLYHTWRDRGSSKVELLKQACRLPGIYVPALYAVHYEPSGQIAAIVPQSPEVPEQIHKAIVADLDRIPYLQAPVVPYLKTVHDRLTLEIMRGCAQGCRFCQAGFTYRPLRERAPEQILRFADALLLQSGYDEVSLSSLSTGDYSQLALLMTTLMDRCEASKVSLSLPSMRVNTLTGEIASTISRVRKTGFTIAPEAGTQRLRDVINKQISDADILSTSEEAFKAGWELLKLYFMIGLPTETDEDIEGMIDLIYRVQKTAQRIAKTVRSKTSRAPRIQLNVGISSFVPKAHTPFQWEPFASIERLKGIQQHLQQRVRHRAIQLKWHDANASYLEAVFARGDRRLGRVLGEAYASGCKFDGWNEHFDFSKWLKAFEYVGLPPDFYVYRDRPEHEQFPWDHIHTGASKAYLWSERIQGTRAEGSPSCSPDCRRCGLCTDEIRVIQATSEKRKATSTEGGHQSLSPSIRPKVFRARAVYRKTDVLRFLSHLDLVRVFQRAVSRINAPIAYSQGFHPAPHIAFGPALPVGMEGYQEYVDFYFSEHVDVQQFVTDLNATLPSGIDLVDAFPIELRQPSLSSILNRFVFQAVIPKMLVEQGYTLEYCTQAVDKFHTQEEYPVPHFRNNPAQIDLKSFIVALDVIPGDAETGCPMLQMSLKTCENITLKPEEVLHLVFEMPYQKILDVKIVRMYMGTEHDVQFQHTILTGRQPV